MMKWSKIFIIGLLFLCVSTEARLLKILVVVPCFPKIHDVCMLNQITGLIDRKNFEVTIYAPTQGDTEKVQKDVLDYDLMSKTIISETFPSELNQYDIVMFQLGHHAINIKKLYGYKGKIVICLRGYDITGCVKNNSHHYDQLFYAADLFMPVCKAFQNILQSMGCDSKKICVIHSGIDCSQFKFCQKPVPQNGEINLLSVGRFVEKKGFEYALAAVSQLIKKYPKLRYTLIGNGPLKKTYRRLIQKFKLEKYITVYDWFAHDEYCALLDKADILIAPSITAANNDQEGIPNVIKEAMAKGVIVIGTTHSGIPEVIVDKVSGILVPERNSYAIANAVTYLVDNTELWPTIQRNARNIIVDKFDKEKVNNALEKALLKLV